MSNTIYNYKLVHLRAFAILTVVFGHSIIIYSNQWNLLSTNVSSPILNGIKTIINCYQMELYFFIAGFLLYSKLNQKIKWCQFVYGKFLRLLIPYLVFGGLWMIPLKKVLDIPSYHNMPISQIIIQFLLGTNNGHLWFLLVLFWIFVISFPLNEFLLARKHFHIWYLIFNIVLCVISLLRQFFHHNYFNLTDVLTYLYPFQLGLSLRIPPPVWCSQKSKWYILISGTACAPLIISMQLKRFCGIILALRQK